MALKSAIFLDKDGTLLQDVPYNVDPDKMVFAPGAREGVAHLANSRLPLIVISNQPGLALGKFGVAELRTMQTRLHQMFEEQGAVLTDCYFCPHYPAGASPAYSRPCRCRKPAPGLLLEAARQHGIDLPRSWFVGDILDDIEAGRRAGCRTILIDNGNETEWVVNDWRIPDYRLADFAAASRLMMSRMTPSDGVPA